MGLLDVNGSRLAPGSSGSGGVWGRVRSLGGLFSRKRQSPHDDDDDDEHDNSPPSKLPRIDASLVPNSIDRDQAEAEVELASSGPVGEARRGRGGQQQPSGNFGARNPNLRINVLG